MIDRDGLQIAFLGVALAHYLDLETGDILDLPLDAEPLDEQRYRRIPTRTPESEAEDRRYFIEKLPFSTQRDRLMHAADDAMAFRRVLSEDRSIEKAWFNFKNERATQAIEVWLREEKLTSD